MVAVKPGEVDGLLRPGARRYAVYLIYGPDSGLVAERTKALAARTATDPDDPFQLVKLDGETIAADPVRLADEAGTVGLFGGARTIWVRPTGRNLAPALEAVLGLPDIAATVLIEAGDLAKSAPLRTLAERSDKAAAIPCYADDDRSLATLVDDRFRQAGISIDRDLRTVLVGHLGGDRLASRAELDKLLLYLHGRDHLTEDDIDAVLSDVSALALDAVVDAAFRGALADADHAVRRLLAEGVHGSVVLGALLRHALTLLPLRADVDRGQTVESALEGWRGLHFRRRPAVTAALRAWTGPRLLTAVRRLDEALLGSRRDAELAGVLTARTVMQLALQARRTA